MSSSSTQPTAGLNTTGGSQKQTAHSSEAGRPARKRRSKVGRSNAWWRHLVAVIMCVFALFPLIYAVSSSLSEAGSLMGSNQLFATVTGAHYQQLFTDPQTPFPRWFVNSLVIATATAVGTTLMGAAAAYAFSRFRFASRRKGLMSLLVIQMFPQLLAFVAIFLLLFAISGVYPFLGLNSRMGLIAVYLGGALGANTFLM